MSRWLIVPKHFTHYHSDYEFGNNDFWCSVLQQPSCCSHTKRTPTMSSVLQAIHFFNLPDWLVFDAEAVSCRNIIRLYQKECLLLWVHGEAMHTGFMQILSCIWVLYKIIKPSVHSAPLELWGKGWNASEFAVMGGEGAYMFWSQLYLREKLRWVNQN